MAVGSRQFLCLESLHSTWLGGRGGADHAEAVEMSADPESP